MVHREADLECSWKPALVPLALLVGDLGVWNGPGLLPWSWNIVLLVPLFTLQSISIWMINSMVAYLLGWFVQKKKKKANRKRWPNTQKGCVFLILLRSRRQSKCSLFCKEPRHEYFLLSGPYSLCHDYSTPSSVTITIENT